MLPLISPCLLPMFYYFSEFFSLGPVNLPPPLGCRLCLLFLDLLHFPFPLRRFQASRKKNTQRVCGTKQGWEVGYWNFGWPPKFTTGWLALYVPPFPLSRATEILAKWSEPNFNVTGPILHIYICFWVEFQWIDPWFLVVGLNFPSPPPLSCQWCER